MPFTDFLNSDSYFLKQMFGSQNKLKSLYYAFFSIKPIQFQFLHLIENQIVNPGGGGQLIDHL